MAMCHVMVNVLFQIGVIAKQLKETRRTRTKKPPPPHARGIE
jgi:hypothetical protein